MRTGVTAIFPHEADPWRERVYAGAHVLNGYGEMIGINQIREWGVLMSPIVLTSLARDRQGLRRHRAVDRRARPRGAPRR